MPGGAAGYSLVELLVVLAIASLMAMLAAPRVVSSLEAGTQRLDSERILSALGAWRAQAHNLETTVRAFVQPVAPNVLRSSLATELDFDDKTRVEIFAADGGKALAFYADGSTGGGEIRLSRGGMTRHIFIEPVSGRIELEAP
jgi:general secretion pathway protein H